MMSSVPKKILRVLLPLIVLAIGAIGAKIMIDNRPAPAKSASQEQVTPVNIDTVTGFDQPVTVRAGGTVRAATVVELSPRVSGEIVWISPNLVPGGRFAKDEIMLRIDRKDYELILEQRKGDLARAQFEVTNERGLAAIAEREWALLGDDVETTEEGRALTLRKPQLARAEANLAAAESAVRKAELDLQRTEIRAPLNALVQMENVDVGQVVNTQSLIASLTGTDAYWIQVSIAVDELAHLDLPDSSGNGGSSARVVLRSDQVAITKTGVIVRLLGDLEQAGRMARLLVSIADPLAGDLPLLLNAYVDVEIQGRPLVGVASIPPESLREGDKVWVMNDEERLEIRTVEVAREERDRVLVRRGIGIGESVVVSRIPAPIPGMKLSASEIGASREEQVTATAGGAQ